VDDRYVFGWYEYDDRAVYFRYPADRSGDLHQDGKRVTVEVYVVGLWLPRDAVVVVTNGDYVVVPRKSSK
jgi:hypothetical protein